MSIKTAPQRNDRVLITENAIPPLVMRIHKILGYDEARHAWNVELQNPSLSDDDDGDEEDDDTIAKTVLVVERPLYTGAKSKARWMLIDANAPLAQRPDYEKIIAEVHTFATSALSKNVGRSEMVRMLRGIIARVESVT